MSHTDLDHDGQRELEQRALRNVRWLAAKLGYQDALDKRRERILMAAMGLGLVVIVAVLYMGAMIRSSADEDDLVRRRCEVDVRARVTMDMRRDFRKQHPEMTPRQLDDLVESSAKTVALSECKTVPGAK